MKTLKLNGKLEFISLWNPIKLQTDDETIDLRDYLFPLFEKINGKKVKMDYTKKHIFIGVDEKSESTLQFEQNKEEDTISFLLKTPTGFSNLNAYLPNILQLLNGQHIIVTIEEDNVLIESNPNQTLYGLYYTKDNSCTIPDDMVKLICHPGTTHCCIFLTASANGFCCEKFDSYMARNLLYRYNEGKMNANRIGDCELLGRKETN
jgi:hypothetical protein